MADAGKCVQINQAPGNAPVYPAINSDQTENHVSVSDSNRVVCTVLTG